jgi:hypothetical protein
MRFNPNDTQMLGQRQHDLANPRNKIKRLRCVQVQNGASVGEQPFCWLVCS